MSKTRTALCLAILLAPLSTRSAAAAKRPRWASEPMSATPDQLLALAQEAAEAADPDDEPPRVRMLVDDVRWTVDEEGRTAASYHRVFQVLHEDAVEGWGSVEVGWSEWHESTPTIDARVISPDGAESALRPEEVAQAPAESGDRTIYTADLSLRAPLPNVAPGAIIEQHIVVAEHRPFSPTGAAEAHSVRWMDAHVPPRLTIDLPADADLRWSLVGPAETRANRRTSRGRVTVSFDLDAPEDAPPPESWLPHDDSANPMFQFTTTPSWAAVSESYHERVRAHFDPEATAELAARAELEGAAPEDKVARALAAVHEAVRYTGLEFGENSIVPYDPADTLRRGYGDCKDQSTLLVSLLRQAGLDAHIALVRPGPGLDIQPDQPGLARFTHAIVYVDSTDQFVDPTARSTPADQVPRDLQGRNALIIREGTRDLTRIPAGGSADATYTEERTMVLRMGRGASVDERTTATGWIANRLRGYRDSTEPDADLEQLERYLEREYGAEKLDRHAQTDPDTPDAEYVLLLGADDTTTADLWSMESQLPLASDLVFKWTPRSLTEAFRDEEGEPIPRRRAMQIAPHRTHLVYRASLPPGHAPRALPEPGTHTWGDASLRTTYAFADGELTMDLLFDTGDGRFTPGEVDAIRALVDGQDWSPAHIVIEDVAASRIARGDLSGFASYGDRIAADPDDAGSLTRLSLDLVEAGFGRAAWDTARRATEAQPDLPFAWFIRGYTLLHDARGRSLTGPFPADEAIAAFERVLELDEDQIDAHLNMALIELNREEPDPAEALRHFDNWQGLREGQSPRSTHLELLLEAGRPDTVVSLTDTETITEDILPHRIVALVQHKGIDAAARDLSTFGLAPGRRAEVIQAGIQLGMRLRDYKAAAALVPLRPDAAALSVVKAWSPEELAALQKMPDPESYPNTPQGAALRFMTAMTHRDRAGLGVDELFSADLRELENSEVLLQAFQAGLEKSLTDTGLTVEVVGDVWMASIEVEESGTPRSGMREVATIGDGPTLNVYVVKEKGRWRVQTFTGVTGALGMAAMGRLDKRDVDGARTWLSWADAEMKDQDKVGARLFREVYDADGDAAAVRTAASVLALTLDQKNGKAFDTVQTLAESTESEEVRVGAQTLLVGAALAKDDCDLAQRVLEGGGTHAELATAVVLCNLDRDADAATAEARAAGARAFLDQLERDGHDEASIARYRRHVEIMTADRSKQYALLKETMAAGEASLAQVNNLAWVGLLEDGPTDEVLAWSAQSIGVQRLDQVNHTHVPRLHTMAAVHTERDDVAAAAQLYRVAATVTPADQQMGVAWDYIVARVTESWGLPEIARAHYLRVEDQESSLMELRDRGLERLGSP